MKMQKNHDSVHTPGFANQSGAASLLMSMIVLALITVVTIFTSKSILTEQKIANNDVRSKQAFEAAEAGLAIAIAYLSEDPDRDVDLNIDPVFDTDADNIGDVNNTNIGGTNRVEISILTPATQLDTIQVRAKGFSDDRKATRSLFRTITVVDPLPNFPDNPMTTRGTVTVTGAATIHNPEGHSTIWSGGDVDLGSNNATATQVADMSDANYPGCMDNSINNQAGDPFCTVVDSSNKVIIGPDVIEYDTNLTNLSGEQFFQNFFGLQPNTYHDSMITLETTAAAVNTDANLAVEEIIWVEGNTAFSGITVGCTTVVTGGNVCPTANTKPMIMIVNGNATFSGTNKFYGILFVMGNIDITGSTTVTGALAAGAQVNNNTGGSLDIWYSSEVLMRAKLNGPMGNASGSWADFCVPQPACLG